MFNDRPKMPRQNLRPLCDTGSCEFGGLGLGTLRIRDYPVQSGTAFLAYTFGLRHAVDPDHIAAITRKLVREGKRLVAFGAFFSPWTLHHCLAGLSRHGPNSVRIQGLTRVGQSDRRRCRDFDPGLLPARRRRWE